nr:uncharacterized protein LOC112027337 [Quercus suber]
MGLYAFAKLCKILRGTGRLKDTKNASVEEQVAKFLYILAHNERIRTFSFFFRHSNEIISRHFHNVLRAVIYLENQFLLQHNGAEDCVEAIDGTHIRVKVSAKDTPRYRGRKEYTTQNVLVACDFDMRFTYVLLGWEGIASDSRIIKNTLSKEDKLIIPRVDTVTEIILACCILHNYLMGIDPDERLIAEVDQEISNDDIHNEARNNTNDSDADARKGAILRTSIATRMWNDYEN